jgi:hypothetical protein
VLREAVAGRSTAQSLVGEFANHTFSSGDTRAMADALFTLAASDAQFSHDEQITMALEAIATGLKSAGDVNDQQAQAIDIALKGLFGAFSSEKAVSQDAFTKALKGLQQAMMRR